jgi:hypothetical protein
MNQGLECDECLNNNPRPLRERLGDPGHIYRNNGLASTTCADPAIFLWLKVSMNGMSTYAILRGASSSSSSSLLWLSNTTSASMVNTAAQRQGLTLVHISA